MNSIKTRQYSDNISQYRIVLYEDKLEINKTFSNNESSEILNIKEAWLRNYPLVNTEFDPQIFVELGKLNKPEGITEEKDKQRQFWIALNTEKIIEEKIVFDDRNFLLKTKNGFVEGYKNRSNVRFKQNIFESLIPTLHDLKISDGFLIFDYNKIKPINLIKETDNKGIYFKVDEGKCTFGGWENYKDGGENYTSIEYLWYHINYRVPSEFKNHIPYIKSVLREAVVS
jgi:hypothetical protein